MSLDESAEPPSIELQLATSGEYVPADNDIRRWASAAANSQEAAVTIRIVSSDEIRTLNRDYRERDSATNVLSFSSDYPPELKLSYLGDIAICAEIVNREAAEQGKTADAHWAHIVIHGILHLQGFDHIDPQDAKQMESREIELLNIFGFGNPYILEQVNRVGNV